MKNAQPVLEVLGDYDPASGRFQPRPPERIAVGASEQPVDLGGARAAVWQRDDCLVARCEREPCGWLHAPAGTVHKVPARMTEFRPAPLGMPVRLTVGSLLRFGPVVARFGRAVLEAAPVREPLRSEASQWAPPAVPRPAVVKFRPRLLLPDRSVVYLVASRRLLEWPDGLACTLCERAEGWFLEGVENADLTVNGAAWDPERALPSAARMTRGDVSFLFEEDP